MSVLPVKRTARQARLAALVFAKTQLRVGDWIYDAYYGHAKVASFSFEQYRKYEVVVHFQSLQVTDGLFGREKWKRGLRELARDLSQLEVLRLDKAPADAEAEAWATFNDPQRMAQLNPLAHKEQSDETALVRAGSDEQLRAMESLLHKRQAQARYVEAIVKERMAQLHHVASDLQLQIKRVQRVIGALQLYLGMYEDITQIQDGQPAAPETPLTFFQQVLYMDEEVGEIYEDGSGVDFRRIEDFDDWLLKGGYRNILPAEKGVRAIQPSRTHRRYYTGNDWLAQLANDQQNSQNSMTYLLIRNGQRFYRIWTNRAFDAARLFPAPDEFEALNRESRYGQSDELKFGYRERALMLQGLIDRSEVFKPMSRVINLLEPDSYGDLVKFVYDDTNILPDGRLPYREWHKQLNADITEGSRVLLVKPQSLDRYYYESSRTKDLFANRFLYYAHQYPELPDNGVYTVYAHAKPHRLCILYNPGDTIYAGWGRYEDEEHTRKKRISFVIKPEDWWVLRYDGLALDEVEFYIQSRVERNHYTNILPALYHVRAELKKEREWEAHFVSLVAQRNDCGEADVWRLVEWWKTKNKWKRPLRQDDAKALRMVEAWLKREASHAK
jgi:hypothetical protein